MENLTKQDQNNLIYNIFFGDEEKKQQISPIINDNACSTPLLNADRYKFWHLTDVSSIHSAPEHLGENLS